MYQSNGSQSVKTHNQTFKGAWPLPDFGHPFMSNFAAGDGLD